MPLTPGELDGLTKDELLDVAAEFDLDVTTSQTKAQIRAAIDASQGTASAAPGPSAARTAFLAGELTWRDYVATENATEA